MSLLAKALGLRPNEALTVVYEDGEWLVLRGGGEVENPALREVVLDSVQYNPVADGYRLRSGSNARRLGVQIRIRA